MLPRFRQDLVAETVEDGGAKFIDVMDPDSGQLFRFYEAEFSLACGMDGERDIAGLVKWARDELGLTATPTEIQNVIATLGDLGYLDGKTPADVPLAPGVVVAPQAAAPPVGDIALGRSGTNARAGGPLPRAPELELGAAGAGPSARPRAPVDDIALGAPGASAKVASSVTTSDVSLDLSDHIAVKPADVKEAVRQSKVMSAVEVPKDLMEQSIEPLAPRPPERMARPPATPPSGTPKPVGPTPMPSPPAPTPVAPTPMPMPTSRAPERARPISQKPPVELPSVPDKRPIAPPAPRRSVSPALLVIAILVIAGGVGFLVWKYIIDRTNEDDTAEATKPVTPPPPPPPVAPQKQYARGKISMQAPGTKTLLSVFAGSVEWIEAKDKPVKSGDIVMKLGGFKQAEATIAALQKDVDKRRTDVEALKKQRDDAQNAGKDAEMKAVQAKLDDREGALTSKDQLLAQKKDKLEELVIKVSHDGVFTPVVKVGQRLGENVPLGTLQPDPEPGVTLEIPESIKMDVGVMLPLERVGAPKGTPLLSCTVADWQPKTMRVACSGVPDLPEGTEVRWELP